MNFESMTVSELYDYGVANGIKVTRKMTKPELLEAVGQVKLEDVEEHKENEEIGKKESTYKVTIELSEDAYTNLLAFSKIHSVTKESEASKIIEKYLLPKRDKLFGIKPINTRIVKIRN